MATLNFRWFTFIWILLYIKCIDAYDCYGNDKKVGYTYPRGDIILEYNKGGLEIFCQINNETYIKSARNPSKYLKFKLKFDELLESQIVNATTIRYFDPNPPKSEEIYSCHIEDENCAKVAVDFNKVFIGTPPAMSASDLNFSCISLNNDNLTCTWNKPNNIFTTSYRLIFKTKTPDSKYDCPLIEMNEKGSQAKCFWDIHTSVPYRQSIPTYIFELYANNSHGNGTFKYIFDHFNHVRPNAPEELTVVNTTTSSMLLQWKISDTMISFTKGLKYRVMYLCEHGPKVWNDDNVGYVKDMKTIQYNLTSLSVAHNLCDIRVSLAPNVSNADNMWSANATITARTATTIPGAPPKVNVGSFEIAFDEAFIYWQRVPEELHNGENFGYNVTLVSGDPNVIIGDVKTTYAVIRNLLPNKTYVFAINSINNYGPNNSLVGVSRESSYITIPARELRPSDPQKVTRMQYDNGTFRIFWNHSKLENFDPSRLSYTVFWCRTMKSRPSKCLGYLDWVEVPYGTTNYTPPIEPENNTVYQTAISANDNDSGTTSGMVWEGCVLAEGNINKLQLDSAYSIGHSSMKLTWSLQGCIITTIKEFIISYCPKTNDPMSINCTETPKQATVNGTLTEATIKELQPYTTYVFWIAVRMDTGKTGQKSDPIRQITSENRPSEPRNLSSTSVGNSSIDLSWQAPYQLNGCVNKYVINHNHQSATYIISGCASKSDIHSYTLDKLESFKTYEISVTACTNFCSQKSKPIRVATMIGYPGRIIQPSAPYINSSTITVKWSKPVDPRGPINNYQIRMVKQREGRRMEHQYFNTTGTSFLVNCNESMTVKYSLSVRALNVADDGQSLLYGPWSEDFVGSCSNSEQIVFWVLIIVLVCLIVGMGLLIKRFYLRVLGMKNVEMTLPAGLTDDFPYNKSSNEREIKKTPSNDEELLLKPRTESNKIPSAESSGCSSAHDSVVSDSGTAISASSAEADGMGMEQSVLRRRQPAYVPMPADNSAKLTPKITSNLYSKVGLDPTLQVDPKIIPIDTAYAFDSSPYVQTVTPIKKLGYVPIDCPSLTTTESDKTPPYVIAGTGTTPKPDVKPYVQVTDINFIIKVNDKI